MVPYSFCIGRVFFQFKNNSYFFWLSWNLFWLIDFYFTFVTHLRLIYCDFLLVSMWVSSNTTYIFMSKNVLVQRVELGLSTDWFSFLWCSQNTFISCLGCFLSILCDNFNFMENKASKHLEVIHLLLNVTSLLESFHLL